MVCVGGCSYPFPCLVTSDSLLDQDVRKHPANKHNHQNQYYPFPSNFVISGFHSKSHEVFRLSDTLFIRSSFKIPVTARREKSTWKLLDSDDHTKNEYYTQIFIPRTKNKLKGRVLSTFYLAFQLAITNVYEDITWCVHFFQCSLATFSLVVSEMVFLATPNQHIENLSNFLLPWQTSSLYFSITQLQLLSCPRWFAAFSLLLYQRKKMKCRYLL